MGKPISRRRAISEYLTAKYGPDSEPLIEVLERIAFGKRVAIETELAGVVVYVQPTLSLMRDAALDLLAYQHGRPRQSVEVEHRDERPKWDPDKLSVTELEQLVALTKKASLPADTVDAEFTVEKPK